MKDVLLLLIGSIPPIIAVVACSLPEGASRILLLFIAGGAGVLTFALGRHIGRNER